jgi:hypothetical protein
MSRTLACFALSLLILGLAPAWAPADADKPWVVYEGKEGPGKGKHVVLVAGGQGYHAEEALPQLAKILAVRHGFTCTVLFSIDRKTGEIAPNVLDNIPGLEALQTADLLVIFTRFVNLPDDQMKHIVAYLDAGKPVVGIRTATHAFSIPEGRTYYRYSYVYPGADYVQGFGRQVLGETWIDHHGHHGVEGTRGLIAKGAEAHPILRGIKDGDVFGPTDVYRIRLPLPGDSRTLLVGQVVASKQPDAKAVEGPKNDPMMPLAWVKTYAGRDGKKGRAFTSTIGAAADLENEGVRRLLVNGVYWALGLEDKIPARSNIELVGAYKPEPFLKFDDQHRKGLRPADLRLK